MNRTATKAVIVVAALAAVLVTSVVVRASEAEKAGEPRVMSRAEVLKSLPCFECHSLDAFMAQPGEGVFSHEMHTMMSGLHCNQCHNIKGHEVPTLKGEACGQCHSTGRMTYSGGGMGKVAFDHAAHGSMFSCGQCHDGTFKMKQGGVKMTMTAMYQGKLCGSCHNGQMAFSSQDCARCHRS
jgi:c(7)-type cytochrome triheme protein